MTPSVQGSLMDPEPDPWILMCPRLMTSAPDVPRPKHGAKGVIRWGA